MTTKSNIAIKQSEVETNYTAVFCPFSFTVLLLADFLNTVFVPSMLLSVLLAANSGSAHIKQTNDIITKQIPLIPHF